MSVLYQYIDAEKRLVFSNECSLYNDLSIIFDLFKERTEGAFLNRSDIPNYIGLSSDPSGNLGIVENKGFDGTINYNATIAQELKLGFRGTFTYSSMDPELHFQKWPYQCPATAHHLPSI